MDSKLEIFSNQSVLITGGGGYLGSKLAEVLSKANANIELLDISFNNASKRLVASNRNVKMHTVDLTKKNVLSQLCKKLNPDYIFHFAAILNRNRDFSIYEKLYSVNVAGTFNLLDAIKDINYKGFFFASTSEVYGTRNKPPFEEDQQPEPTSPYSLTKFMAESLCKTYSDLHSKPFTVFRFFNFFGPDMPDETFIGQMLAHYRNNTIFSMTKGIQKRDFVFIDNLIDQVLFVVNTKNRKHNVFNICSGKPYMMIEIATMFRELTENNFNFEKSLGYRPNEIWEMFGTNERLLELGYKPKNELLIEGLKKILIN